MTGIGWLVTACVLLLCGLSGVHATHFRYGTITWKIPDETKPWNVLFSFTFGFRRSFYNSNFPATANFAFGDGTAATVNCPWIFVDAVNDWGLCSGTIQKNYTIPSPSNITPRNFTMFHSSTNRISTLNNNRDTQYNISTLVTINQPVLKPNGASVPNTSPISGNLPIIPVYMNEVNTFNIVSIDDETPTDQLTYQLASGRDMGAVSSVPPPNFSVDRNGTVTFDTRGGVAQGYWCAQVKIFDNIAYSVVDFLIDNQPRPRVCGPTCSNAGARCTADSNCVGCTGGNAGQCVLNPPPFLVTPPTPFDGETFVVSPNVTSTWVLVATSLSQGATTTLTYNAPPGSEVSTIQTGEDTTVIITWRPTAAQAGSYVVILGCYDSTNAQCVGQRSFSITVRPPPLTIITQEVVYASRLVPLSLNVTVVGASDPADLKYEVVSYNGYFFSFSGVAFLQIGFTAPADAQGEKYVSVRVTDSHGGSADAFITIVILPNTPPQASSAGPIVVSGSNSSLFTLTGSDVDFADQGNLMVVLVFLPAKSVLHSSNGTPVTVPGAIVADHSFYLTSNGLQGEDSLTFRLRDNLGALSPPKTVRITVA